MQSKDKAGALGQPPRRFSANSRSSSASAGGSFNSQTQHTHVYDIDDSFNDSYLDEITEETNQTYLNNKARMNDLRLPKQNEAAGNSNVIANTPVKWLKIHTNTNRYQGYRGSRAAISERSCQKQFNEVKLTFV